MSYYLETSAVFSLARSLNQVKDCSTSYFALHEIIAGTDQSNFSRRQPTMRRILDSGIEIISVFPVDILTSHFEEKKPSERGFYKVITTFAEATSYFEFVAKCSTQNLPYKPGIESTLDNIQPRYFNNLILAAQARIRNESRQNVQMQEKLKEFQSKEKLALKQAFCLSLAKAFCGDSAGGDELLLTKCSEVLLRDFPYFVDGLFYFINYHLFSGQEPKRNDILDLSHIIYLGNDSQKKLVSDDKLHHKIGQTLWPSKVLPSMALKNFS